MLGNYAFVLILSAVVLIIPIGGIVLGWALGPKRPDVIKNATYESGVETIGDTWVQFKAQYYIYALIFLVFDVEIIFLYPWAIAYNAVGIWAVLEAVLFIFILAGGLGYAWRKGALDWQ